MNYSRPRLNRASSFEETCIKKVDWLFKNPMEDPKKTDTPYKIYVKVKDNTSVFPQEIITHGE
jgi:hypothetical protein